MYIVTDSINCIYSLIYTYIHVYMKNYNKKRLSARVGGIGGIQERVIRGQWREECNSISIRTY